MAVSVFGFCFIGDGIYDSSVGGNGIEAYKAWVWMIRRCYSKSRIEKFPTYKDCYVCDEWRNFQNFAKWYYENHPSDGNNYHLDKDIKIDGNKEYSPDTCLFVSPRENSQKSASRTYRFISDCGVEFDIFNLEEFCRENKISIRQMRRLCYGEVKSFNGWRLRV